MRIAKIILTFVSPLNKVFIGKDAMVRKKFIMTLFSHILLVTNGFGKNEPNIWYFGNSVAL